MGNQIDGLVACISQQTRKIDHFKLLKQQGVPIVFFDRAPEKIMAHRILFDNEACAFQLTEHMLKSGFGRIALLTGPEHLAVSQEQIQGYRKALKRYRKEFDPVRLLTTGFGYQDGCMAFQKLFRHHEQPDAVLAGSDQLAIAVLMEARRVGLMVPNYLGLAACGGDPFLARNETPVTSVGAKGFEMGSRAAYLCIQDIENTEKVIRAKFERITTDIIIRQSSMRSAGGEYATGDYRRLPNHGASESDEVHIY